MGVHPDTVRLQKAEVAIAILEARVRALTDRIHDLENTLGGAA